MGIWEAIFGEPRDPEISTPKERQRENDEQNPLPPWWRAW